MSELIEGASSCHMCDRPANNFYTGTNRWSIGKEFCSSNCKDAHLGKLVTFIGGGILVFSFIMIIAIGTETYLLLFILGLGIAVFGLYYMSLATPTKRIFSKETVNLSGQSNDYTGEPQDQMIYSNILLTVVHPCCHQSARLNDQYCACGRAIEYPNPNDRLGL